MKKDINNPLIELSIQNLFILFFFLLPWGNFFFRKVDCWHGLGHYVQVGVLILFCYSFFNKPNKVLLFNRPLGSFLLWAGLVTAYGWIRVFSLSQHYPINIFMPFFNLLCLILLYKMIVEYLDKSGIEKILKWLKYSVVIFLFYCVLQYFKLDEFFKGYSGYDELVGTIGNTRHLAGLLAIIQPVFFKKTIRDVFSLVLLWLIIFAANSATGVVAGIGVILFWLFFKKRKLFIPALILSSLSCVVSYIIDHSNSGFFFNSDRLNVWGKVWEVAKNHFITGFGLGSYGLMEFKVTRTYFKHLHNDYYQVVFELGIIGLVLVLWCLWDYFRMVVKLKDDLSIKLGAMFCGFCLLSLVSFPSHLWLISTLSVFAYAGTYAIKNEVLNGD